MTDTTTSNPTDTTQPQPTPDDREDLIRAARFHAARELGSAARQIEELAGWLARALGADALPDDLSEAAAAHRMLRARALSLIARGCAPTSSETREAG